MIWSPPPTQGPPSTLPPGVFELDRPDTERLRELRQHIAEHPEQHDQQHWWTSPQRHWWDDFSADLRTSCGTTACAAGWACWLAYPQAPTSDDGIIVQGQWYSMAHLGRVLLGLNGAQAHLLFHSNLTTQEVLDILDALIEDHKIVPTPPSRWADG